MSHNLLQGRKGEDLAFTYLKNKGFRIKAKNWRHRHKEIDLIAEYEGTLVIAEVKTRQNNSYGRPEEFVSRTKQRFLIQAANSYIRGINWWGETRFDVISITLEPKVIIEHFEAAFYP